MPGRKIEPIYAAPVADVDTARRSSVTHLTLLLANPSAVVNVEKAGASASGLSVRTSRTRDRNPQPARRIGKQIEDSAFGKSSAEVRA